MYVLVKLVKHQVRVGLKKTFPPLPEITIHIYQLLCAKETKQRHGQISH